MDRINWILLTVTSCANLAHGKQREGVVIRGTTIDPKLVRVAGKAANHCPPDYPWPLNDYDHCCKHFWSGLDDNQVLTPKNGIDSCPEGDIVKCPIGKCRTNPHTEVLCPEGFPFPLREGCCKKRLKLFIDDTVDANKGCDGEIWTPKDKRGQCCPGNNFVEVKECKEGSRTCKQRPDQCQGNPLLVYRVDTGVNPKGYTQPSEDVSKNYADAQAQCQAQGMQLMMSKTEDEYLMMLDITSRNELQYWIGLANPNSVICTNDECNGQMVWGNANGSLFHYETYHTQSTISDDGNPCMRVYFGPNYDDPSIDASGDFNDLGCDIILPFVCEMECYQ